MARAKLSIRHLQIDKANRSVVLVITAAVSISIFGLFIGRAMLLRQAHQGRVIAAKEKAVSQLQANIEAKDKIVEAYRLFTSGSTNMLGGDASSGANGERDGDNARLVLDALPSKYDFPALATSFGHILDKYGLKMGSFDGTDEEVTYGTVGAVANPEPVEIPFGVSVIETDYDGVRSFINLLETSIRPFKINSLNISGSSNSMRAQTEVTTYFQPEKVLTITKKEVQ